MSRCGTVSERVQERLKKLLMGKGEVLRDRIGRAARLDVKKCEKDGHGAVRPFGKARQPCFWPKSGAPKPSGEAKREKTRTQGEAFQEPKCIYARFLGGRRVKVRFSGRSNGLFPVWGPSRLTGYG